MPKTIREAIEETVSRIVRADPETVLDGVRALWDELDLAAVDRRALAMEGLANRVRVRLERGKRTPEERRADSDFWSKYRRELIAALSHSPERAAGRTAPSKRRAKLTRN
jgi:hypothetical protein